MTSSNLPVPVLAELNHAAERSKHDCASSSLMPSRQENVGEARERDSRGGQTLCGAGEGLSLIFSLRSLRSIPVHAPRKGIRRAGASLRGGVRP